MAAAKAGQRHSGQGQVLDETAFLQVCLHHVTDMPGARETAAMLLAALDRGADVPETMRAQVPLFAHACGRLGVLRGAASMPKLTALSLREARRNALIHEGQDQIWATLGRLGIAATDIRGPMLGIRFYPAPDVRHTHALKLAVFDAAAHGALVSALQAESWQDSRFTARAPGYRAVLTSPAGVEVEVYQRLLPHSDHIPKPSHRETLAFQVAMILCQAPFEPQRHTKRWICDLAFIFDAGDVDLGAVVALAETLGMAGSCSDMLHAYLRVVPGSDATKVRRVAEDLAARLSRDPATPPRNSTAANAALRDAAPVRRGLLRRALSGMKRALVAPRPRGTRP